MSTPGENAVPRVRPNVYHLYEAADPTSYEEYRDPAAAHGWENAYDETTELPRIAPARAEPGGRADRRRAARRTDGRRSRRVIVAVGAVSLAAAIAGYAGWSSGDAKSGETRTERPDEGSASPAAGSPRSASGTPGPESAAAPAETSPSPSAAPASPSQSAVTGPGTSATQSPTAASQTPTTTPTAGNGGRGHGRGGVKRR
ncbi:hypothetical protein [Streptomyces sp. ME18-1-4]|jgi:hypothetical protein|uniref:hypothetical protein n=1 Tax=Streptomyces sp. ME18-1-4 TaxID=3028685 RepID=UPI0029B0A0DB|nr:hypothetical protein [Streptomyces sp. ME18-1-4]MDX3243074.1 hypothetical protein [Streptomyces sp. ME18-1-4]